MLTSAGTDNLIKLFTHGASKPGDLPSKAGIDELIENGLAKCGTANRKYRESEFYIT